jgi:hypothetical protein
MAKWEGFSEEDIKKVRACERLVEGNVLNFRKVYRRINNLTESEIWTTFWGIRLWRWILGLSTDMHAQSGSDSPLAMGRVLFRSLVRWFGGRKSNWHIGATKFCSLTPYGLSKITAIFFFTYKKSMSSSHLPNRKRQIAWATGHSRIVGPEYGTGLMSPMWRPEFGGCLYISRKFLDPLVITERNCTNV